MVMGGVRSSSQAKSLFGGRTQYRIIPQVPLPSGKIFKEGRCAARGGGLDYGTGHTVQSHSPLGQAFESLHLDKAPK